MIDDQSILSLQRLRDDLANLKSGLRKRYNDPNSQVTAEDFQSMAARLAEIWMVDLNITRNPAVVEVIPSDYLADLNIHFQRILSFSEKASKRSRYDLELKAILRDFTAKLIIPMKQSRHQVASAAQTSVPQVPGATRSNSRERFRPTAFVSHSFEPHDGEVAQTVIETLRSIDITVVTGQKPKAERISEKVKKRIDDQHLFVGIFTRRKRIARSKEWTTSPWLIDEKAYAVGKGKKLILLRENGVDSIGGIQGDYEYIEFSRDRLQTVVVNLLELFSLSVVGLA